VQNCAQIDRKCTLFRPKTPFFAHFCRGEGRLFGRPILGVFGGPGRRAGAARAEGFCFKIPSRCKSHRAHQRQMYVSRASIATAILLSGRTNKHSELAERTESCYNLILSFFTLFFNVCFGPAQRGFVSKPRKISKKR
jgi:hypothetical protein